MPVSVDDPFLLVSFSSTAHPHQHQAVTCTPESKQPKQPQDEEEEENLSSLLVVAIQGEGVQLFNTSDQKCVLSYSTPPGYSFVGPAQTLLSPQLRHVYAVIARGTDIPAKEEGKVVWLWKDEVSSSSIVTIADANNAMQEDSVKPSSARKTVHKFDRKIHQLIASPLLLNNVLLANTDGSISLVTDDLKRVISTDEIHTATAKPSRKEKKNTSAQDQSMTMIWATTFNSSESWIPSNILVRNTLVLMTIVESSVGKIIVTLSYVNEERRGFFTFGQVELEHALGLSGFDFDAKMGHLSFMTAAGQLKVYGFEVSQGDHIVMASETLTLPLPGYSVTSNTAASKTAKRTAKTTVGFDPTVQHVDAVALGDNYLAIAGAHRNENKVEQTITIWDVKYGTLQAKHVVPGTFTAENTTCQLVLLPGSVLAMTISTLHNNTIKSDIYLCPFYAEPMSLLGAMGKMAGTAPFLGQKGSLLVQDAHTLATTTHLAPSNVSGVVKAKDVLATGSDLESQLRTAQDAERKALELLSSESNAFTVQEFEEIFFNHVEYQIADATKDVMERYGVDADEAKAAVAQEEEKAAQKDLKKQKQHREQETKSTRKMDIDTEPGVEDVHSAKDGSKSKKKKKSQTDKAAGSEKESYKEAKVEKKSKSKAAKSKTDGSSSESSSEDDDDHEDEAIVLSSDEEQDHDVEDEEQEYEIDDEEDTTRTEAYKDALQEWRRIEAEAIIRYKMQRRLLRAGRKQTPLPDLSHHFVTTVVSRSFGRLPNGQPDMSFWPTKVVEYLIENQLVGNSNPGAGQAGIALNLMERGQWSILELALKKLYDIPELDMIMMLKQVIGLNKKRDWMDVKESAVDSIASSMASSVPDTPHLLNLIMGAPRNEVFMQQALKHLSIEELSVVLGILRDWIDLWDERGGIGHQGQRPAKKQLPGGLPGYGLMVDFTTLIMDVHFPSLILSPHLHPVLKAIRSSIQRETHVAHQLEQALRGPLGLFDRKHREIIRRKEASMAGPVGSGNSGAGGAGDKRRRRKWEGGEGIPDYAVEIIHL